MGKEEQITVQLKVTRVPELLPVIQGFVDRLADQLNFKEHHRLNLKQGIGQVCAPMMKEGGDKTSGEMQLEFNGFSDRLEIVLESDQGSEASETQAFLLNQVLDRVSVEETPQGGQRLTLVKYNQ